jgi:hypothetical protein
MKQAARTAELWVPAWLNIRLDDGGDMFLRNIVRPSTEITDLYFTTQDSS